MGDADGVAALGGGASTSRAAVPIRLRSPGTRVIRDAPARRASASIGPIRASVGESVPVAMTPTDRPRTAPASPVT